MQSAGRFLFALHLCMLVTVLLVPAGQAANSTTTKAATTKAATTKAPVSGKVTTKGPTSPTKTPVPGGSTTKGPTPPTKTPVPGKVTTKGPTPPTKTPVPGGSTTKGPKPPTRTPVPGRNTTKGPKPPTRTPVPGGKTTKGPKPPTKTTVPGGKTTKGPKTPTKTPVPGGKTTKGPKPPTKTPVPGGKTTKGPKPPTKTPVPGGATTKGPPTTKAPGLSPAETASVSKSLDTLFKEPRKPCNATSCPDGPPANKVPTADQATAYLNSLLGSSRSSMFTKKKAIKYGQSANNRPLLAVKLSPYYVKNVRNPKHVPNRPSVFIEAGIEGNLPISSYIAFNLIAYLESHIVMHKNLDYYVVPLINAGSYGTSSPKTDQPLSGTSCIGVNLLNNFAHGNFAAANTDPCNDLYGGPSAMSAPETGYQTKVKSSVKNIILSVTLTKVGSVVSVPYAYKTGPVTDAAKYNLYLEAYKASATGFTSGSYYDKHGMSAGHPLDYNFAKYGNSFNVAVEPGTGTGGSYDHKDEQLQDIFKNFVKGLFGMISHAVSQS